MATTQELATLAASTGRDRDILFLTLMIRHHRGSLAMAPYARQHATRPEVRALAAAIIVAQSADITALQADLRRLGAPAA